MPVHEARIPGFHKHSLTERHRILSENTSIPIDEITRALHGGGIDPETAEKMPTDKLVDISPMALRMSSPFNAGYWLTAA